MKRLILTLQNFTDDSNAIHYFDQRGFEFLADIRQKERERIVKTFFKFIFVRNPLDRILSAYRNKFHSVNIQFHATYGRHIVRRYRKPSVPVQDVKGHDVTFREFVKYLIDKRNSLQNMNEHWMPMFELCQPCFIKYDFIGSFEDLEIDTNALLAKLNAAKGITFPRKQAQYGQPISKEKIAAFYANISAEEYRSLHERYKNDFKCFSYRFFWGVRNKA